MYRSPSTTSQVVVTMNPRPPGRVLPGGYVQRREHVRRGRGPVRCGQRGADGALAEAGLATAWDGVHPVLEHLSCMVTSARTIFPSPSTVDGRRGLSTHRLPETDIRPAGLLSTSLAAASEAMVAMPMASPVLYDRRR